MDFHWTNAKAAHAVLLCEMERGTVLNAYVVHMRKDTKDLGKNGNHIIRNPGYVSHIRQANVTTQKIMKLGENSIGKYVQTAWGRAE